MAARALCFLSILWAQEKPTIHYWTDKLNRTSVVWVAVAWRHAPHLWEVGDVLTEALMMEAYRAPFAISAESLGIQLYRWTGPEGAAIALTAPRAHLIAAVDWLYALLTRLPMEANFVWKSAWHQYQRRWTGFSLERELFWRLCGSAPAPATFPWDSVAQYLDRYLRINGLQLIVAGSISMRERMLIGRMRPPLMPASTTEAPPLILSPVSDTTEENLWAYPAYVALQIDLPEKPAERIAFIQAFLHRWQSEAPPLRWQGRFWGNRTYLLQARLDGRSYTFLRHLTYLAPRDTAEGHAWKAAYTLARQRLLAHPETALDFWIGAFLRGDTVVLPDTLPDSTWQRGWSFTARGIWLQNEWLSMDTLSPQSPAPDTVWSAEPRRVPLDLIWLGKGKLPLREWAAYLMAFRQGDTPQPCELIGYYKRVKDRTKRTKELHAIRRQLIQSYGIPPSALRVVLRPVPPDIPLKALRLKCTEP